LDVGWTDHPEDAAVDSDGVPVSLVLTALPLAARAGRLVGRAEVVDTGEVVVIRSLEELTALLQRLAADPPAGDETTSSGGSQP
jgi:hypothetical protein